MNEKNIAIAEKLEAFAASRDHTMLELAFSWLAPRSQVASVTSPSRSNRTSRRSAGSSLPTRSWTSIRSPVRFSKQGLISVGPAGNAAGYR